MRRFGKIDHRSLIAGLAAAAAMQMLVSIAQAQSCPNNPTPAVNSPQSPDDVCIPSGFGGNPIAFFDDYSWRVFLSVVWPAKQGERGCQTRGSQSGPVLVHWCSKRSRPTGKSSSRTGSSDSGQLAMPLVASV